MNEEITRILANLVRIGSVKEVDTERARVRVQTGGLVTDWLPWTSACAGKTSFWSAPEIGAQALLLVPTGEMQQALVIGFLYQRRHAPPAAANNIHALRFADNAVLTFDHSSGELTLRGIKKISFQADEIDFQASKKISFSADEMTLKASKKISFQADDMTLKASQCALSGAVTHSGKALTSNGIAVHDHMHSGVQPGPALTGMPL